MYEITVRVGTFLRSVEHAKGSVAHISTRQVCSDMEMEKGGNASSMIEENVTTDNVT